MSTISSPTDTLPLVVPYHPARVSVADYHKMIADGALTENHRLELLKGVLVEKMTNNPPHSVRIVLLQTLLGRIIPSNFHLRAQLPITLADSEPEPDLVVARGESTDYEQRHPNSAETPLVIEVSASSLVTDRFKAEIYAEAGIPLYWIVNLAGRCVEVYSQPVTTSAGRRYGEPRLYQASESVPVTLDGKEIGRIDVHDMLPKLPK